LGAVLLAAVLAVVLVGLARGRDSGDRTVVRIIGDPLTASNTVDGLTLTVSVERASAVAGGRLVADIRLRNGRATSVRWESDGCGEPFAASLAVTTPTSTTWNGDLAALAASTSTADSRSHIELHDIRYGGQRGIACDHQRIAHEVASGAELRERGVADLRVDDDDIPTVPVELSATFSNVTVKLPITVVDAPARRGSRGAALQAFATDNRLADFVGEQRSWRTDLSWWNGAWELWIDPSSSNGTPHSLRLRYDPTTRKVIDVRRIVYGQVPANDPDFEPAPGSEPDVLIP
jgi:hypothetical protein